MFVTTVPALLLEHMSFAARVDWYAIYIKAYPDCNVRFVMESGERAFTV